VNRVSWTRDTPWMMRLMLFPADPDRLEDPRDRPVPVEIVGLRVVDRGSFWLTTAIALESRIASSIRRSVFSRPTEIGMTVFGNGRCSSEAGCRTRPEARSGRMMPVRFFGSCRLRAMS